MSLRRGLSLLAGAQHSGGARGALQSGELGAASASSFSLSTHGLKWSDGVPLWLSAAFPQQIRGYKKQGNEVRAGNVLEYDGKLYQVMKQDYTQGQGRQLGNVHLVLKDLVTGTQRLEKMRPADSVEVARLEEKTFNFLYREGDIYFMMDPETYEQISLDKEVLGSVTSFIAEDSPVKVAFHQDQPITGSVPKTVTLEVTEAEVSSKGESATGTTKSATLSTGLTLKVPGYINTGERIVVDTETSQFVKRA